MIFSIDPKSSKTVYQQIINRVKNDVARGALAPGDKLPTIRELAATLRVNRNTVAKAYQELERENIIFTRPGGGSFIADSTSDLQMKERTRILEEMAKDLVVQAFHFQIDNDKLFKIISKQIELIERGNK